MLEAFTRYHPEQGLSKRLLTVNEREQTITRYTECMAFLQALGWRVSLPANDGAVVNRSGWVLASVGGDYASEKAVVLVKALPQQP